MQKTMKRSSMMSLEAAYQARMYRDTTKTDVALAKALREQRNRAIEQIAARNVIEKEMP